MPKNHWDDAGSAQFQGDLQQRVYTSRLLGRDPMLVLHGGGNTSVKVRENDLFGEPSDVLYVKGSGWDLETIEVRGFTPVRLDHLLKLAELERLSDLEMARQLQIALVNPSAPAPSVEAILHAILPSRFVDHTHPDALLSVTNAPDAERRVREIYGRRVVIVPYVMPGFRLARVCAERFPRERTPETVGMVLMHHGLFTWGDTARESYERMIELVAEAEAYLDRHGAWRLPQPPAAPASSAPPPRAAIADLRRDLSRAAGFPLLMRVERDARALSFARRPDAAAVSQEGPATPDHVIRTKRVPLLGRDVAGYVSAYERYFREHAGVAGGLAMLDPAPRVVLDPELGLCSAGRSAHAISVVSDLYRHTMDVVERACLLGGWHALSPADIFEVEYWDLEQAKLRRGGAPRIFEGEAALVTGAASGIGRACVDALVARGAAVTGLDRDAGVETIHRRHCYQGVLADVTRRDEVVRALDAAALDWGGLDMLVLCAGVFPPTRRIEALDDAFWEETFRVNLDANLALLREAHPLLASAPKGGRVVVVASKNVPAPGPGAAAYSASKAALTQLARVAALEWGRDGIRVNVLHPHGVFDTGAWTEAALRERAEAYGMTVEQYRRNNVLGTEVVSRDVGELAAEMCGPLFAKTTGAQIPVDGGNDRVI